MHDRNVRILENILDIQDLHIFRCILCSISISHHQLSYMLAHSHLAQVALDLLLPRDMTPPALPSPGPSNPLAFLREVPEFHFLRVLVLQQPELLQPLLIRYKNNCI